MLTVATVMLRTKVGLNGGALDFKQATAVEGSWAGKEGKA